MVRVLTEEEANAMANRTKWHAWRDLLAESYWLLLPFLALVVVWAIAPKEDSIGFVVVMGGMIFVLTAANVIVRRPKLLRACMGGHIILARVVDQYVYVLETDERIDAAVGIRTYPGIFGTRPAWYKKGYRADRWTTITREFGGGPCQLTAYVLTDWLGHSVRVSPTEHAVLDHIGECARAFRCMHALK